MSKSLIITEKPSVAGDIAKALGGFKKGITYGETDEYGHHATVDKIHMHDLHATLLYALGLDHEQRCRNEPQELAIAGAEHAPRVSGNPARARRSRR